MASHARMHSRHALLSHHHQSIPETVALHTETIVERGTMVNVAPRETSAASSDGGFNPTIPIAVGICVPLVVIVVTFLWLHRRHVKKIAAEERSDPHKSLDFGLGNKSGSSRGATGGVREMGQVDFEKSLRRGRGLSMDIGSPYLLPPELQNSRESLASLSRNMVHEAHDPYRPATEIFQSGPMSARNSEFGDDTASVRTGFSSRMGRPDQMAPSSPLVPNAQRMPFSNSPSPALGEQPRSESRSQSRSPLASPPIGQTPPQNNPAHVQPPPAAYRPQEPPKAISPKPPSPTLKDFQLPQELPSEPYHHTHAQTISLPEITIGDAEDNHDHHDQSSHIQQPIPQHSNMAPPLSPSSEQFYTPTEENHGMLPAEHEQEQIGLGVSDVPFDNRRISVLRPLPPDDPHESPQERAKRIRSFYKEYFNENDAHVYQQGPNDYYEDYGQEYLDDGTIYDPVSGQFIVSAPYAEPIGRRAMTPPPRGPPRFNQSRHTSAGSSPGVPGYRARAFSTASAGPGGQFRGRQPKRQAPPPKALRTLPTPHLLKEDAFTLPIDFAPPVNIKDQAAGRAASPRMESRPFSPAVAIASPLQSSFNELPAMPSPHHLRRSGTFTALDFAPPPRFRDSASGSDAGSIRSGRSNHSTSSRMQVQNIRAGAYRVSRIPKELVGTHNELSEMLKPTWKVGS